MQVYDLSKTHVIVQEAKRLYKQLLILLQIIVQKK